MPILSYLFYPNPGNASYDSPKAMALLAVCVLFIVLAVALRFWRSRLKNPVTKKLSASWFVALLWFGITGIVMVVSRVESIQFLAMRFLWVVWAAVLVVYVLFQARRYQQRHYTVMPKVQVNDPRGKYLPTKKKHS